MMQDNNDPLGILGEKKPSNNGNDPLGILKKKETTVSPSVQKQEPTSSVTPPKGPQKPSVSSVSEKPEGLYKFPGNEKAIYKKQGNEWYVDPSGSGKFTKLYKGDVEERVKLLEGKAVSYSSKKEENGIFSGVPGKEETEYVLDTSGDNPVWAERRLSRMPDGTVIKVVNNQTGKSEDKYHTVPITDPTRVQYLNKYFKQNASTDRNEKIFTGLPNKEKNEYKIEDGVWLRRQPGQDDWTKIYDETAVSYLNKNFNKNILLSFLNNKLNKVYKSYKKIRLLKNISQIPFKENFSLSGLNLAFLGYLENGKIKLHEKLLHWPDGILKKMFYENQIKKIPGYTLISSIRIPYFINEIFVYGLLSKKSKNYLCKKFPHKKILHIDLPYDKIENLYKFCPRDLKKNQIIFLTLPTPKQEQFAARIVKLNKYFKIICIGGGISIASGDEVRVPKFMNKFNLEFIWRLRTDSTRRFARLIYTFFLYLRGTLNFKFARIKFLTFK